MTTPNTQSAGADASAFEGHTPGPWEKDGQIVEWEDKATGWRCTVADCSTSYTLQDAETEANARLIAAAPSLLSEVLSLRDKLAASEASRAELVGALELAKTAMEFSRQIHDFPSSHLPAIVAARQALANARATQEGGAQ